MRITPQALQAVMDAFFGGSDGRYRHPFCRRFIYTEGVKAMAEAAGAYWLLDIVATEVAPLALALWDKDEIGSFMFEMKVADGEADLALTWSDDQPAVWKRHIHMTDFPDGEWTFELGMDGLIDPQREVLVMLLIQEH